MPRPAWNYRGNRRRYARKMKLLWRELKRRTQRDGTVYISPYPEKRK